MEITSTGMMRSFVAVPCDVYFTVERKIARFWSVRLRSAMCRQSGGGGGEQLGELDDI